MGCSIKERKDKKNRWAVKDCFETGLGVQNKEPTGSFIKLKRKEKDLMYNSTAFPIQ